MAVLASALLVQFLAVQLASADTASTALTKSINSYAMSFDGISSYAEIPFSPYTNPANELTVEGWFNIKDINKWRNPLFGSGYGQLYLCPLYESEWGGAQLHFGLSAGGTRVVINSPLNPISANTWYHIAGTYDGSEIRLYLNGVLQASAPLSGPIDYIGYPIMIGNYPHPAPHNFEGTIDEVRIWDRALPKGEIQAHLARQLLPLGGLTGYWRFNEGDGTVAKDLSGNNNDCILVINPAWTVDTPF